MASTTANLFQSEDFKEAINNLANTYAVPALLGIAGTGALGAHLAAKNEIGHESTKARRKRILRSALFPAATTAAALAALGGAAALSDIDTTKIDNTGILDNIHPVDFLAKNMLIPAGVIAGGLGAGIKAGIPEGRNGTGKALLRFRVGDNGKTLESAKDLKNDFLSPKTVENLLKNLGVKSKQAIDIRKKLPRIVSKRGPLATALWLAAGATGGAVADEITNTVLY